MQDFYRVSLSKLAFPVLGVRLSQDVMIQYVNALDISLFGNQLESTDLQTFHSSFNMFS